MKILFLGDSITDVGRNTNNGSLISIGQGYPLLVDACLSVKYPGEYTFENLGISGNRIVDVYARIKADCWNRKPDLVSILIGVNDVWHEFGGHNGVEADRFYNVYRMLVTDTKRALPESRKMILMEPFVLKASATEGAWEAFRSETEKRAEAVRRIAGETGQIFLPLQATFDEAAQKMPASYWLGDGVHPTPAGHGLIADAWVKCFEENFR